MVYRAIGLMSGSSLDGLDIVFAELEESGGRWQYQVRAAECIVYDPAWEERLRTAQQLDAYRYLLLHSAYGKYLGQQVNDFIDRHQLHHQVQLIASHGHTSFHAPALDMTAQLGNGASIAAVTGINVVSDLRALDVALEGEGAPIVPAGEKLLLGQYHWFLNLGGIANISRNQPGLYSAYDVAPANRVLNLLAQEAGQLYDDAGRMAATGSVHPVLLTQLNSLDYYRQPYPKSLANDFGTQQVYPLIRSFALPVADASRTYTEHLVQQIRDACIQLQPAPPEAPQQLLLTGGGAFNTFLVQCLQQTLQPLNMEVVVPDKTLVQYKEALVMALLGILRWREENTVFASVTGARRSSIGGAVWMGQQA